MDSLISLNSRLLDKLRDEDFAGFDPFDSLNSRLLSATPFYRNSFIRLAWLQLGKRSPINLRPLLGVPKRRNPKGIGLVISGLVNDYHRTGEVQLLDEAGELAQWLLEERSSPDTWAHSCWGYHFDWQARAFYVPAGKPNIITTCYVARALFELGKVTGNESFIAASLDAARFISRHLYTEADGRCFYAYIPGESAFVHNASLWGAAWCGFAGKELGDDALVDQALEVARQSVQEQLEDGSWVYGSLHHHQFKDGFHTGYNLEALNLLRDALQTDEFDECIAKGYRHYVETFFEADGTAKYYDNSVYPLDMHSFAQAIFTLLKVGGRAEDLAFCEKVIQRAIELMYRPSTELFIYQKTRHFTNRINYMRWTQAWAYCSFSFFNRFRAEFENASN